MMQSSYNPVDNSKNIEVENRQWVNFSREVSHIILNDYPVEEQRMILDLISEKVIDKHKNNLFEREEMLTEARCNVDIILGVTDTATPMNTSTKKF